ncbi:unnamed protein product, partial [Rotaria sordida]
MTLQTTIMSVSLSKTSKNAPVLIYNGYSYTIDRKSETEILWKRKYSRKYACHGRLHTKLNYEFIKTVGEHENHTGNSRCEATRKYYEKLKQESEQNQTNPHNILTQINIGVPDELVPAWQPQQVMMDFEKATINVFSRTFPAVELSGCYFHFCQNVLRFLQTNGFKQMYETDVTFADNIHKILALAFIDPILVIDAFELLCSNLNDDYQQTLDYIEDNYIERLRGHTRRQASYPIDIWNMVPRMKNYMHRTNNHVEEWHRKLYCAFQCSHPSLWTFLDKLIKEENNIHSDILNAMTGRRPSVGKYESFNRRLRNLVENPHPNIYDQLTCTG